MPAQSLYIYRRQAENFHHEFSDSLKDPTAQQIIFHLWGIGGVGKTTLLRRIKRNYHEEARFAEVSFGLTVGIDTPIDLMAKLHQQALQEKYYTSSSFAALFEKYQQTRYELESQPDSEKRPIDPKQVERLRGLLKLAASAVSIFGLPTATIPSNTLDKAVDVALDSATLLLNEKDRLQQLLQQHAATKRDRELQMLMLEPLPKLTSAFLEDILQQAQNSPLVLMLDTYEKASTDIDTWIWQCLLCDLLLKEVPNKFRLMIAGRRCLLETDGWRKLQQDRNIVYERRLEPFDREQTTRYLKKASIHTPDKIKDIYHATRGLPYYLNWIREEKAASRGIDFSRGNQAVISLLLQGLTEPQKKILNFAACCRWFNRELVSLAVKIKLVGDEAEARENDYFTWLKKRVFVEPIEAGYRLNDVARDILRQALWQDNPSQFQYIHTELTCFYKRKADRCLTESSTVFEQYEDEDWCNYISEYLYHLLFSGNTNAKEQFISYLFSAHYLNKDSIFQKPFQAILAEADLVEYPLLNKNLSKFLDTASPIIRYSQQVLDVSNDNFSDVDTKLNIPKHKIVKAVNLCLRSLNSLEGLAKFSALLCKAQYCPKVQQVKILEEAQCQAWEIATTDEPEFSSHLFCKGIGNALSALNEYERAIENYKEAIVFNCYDDVAWNNKGYMLAQLKRYEEAIESYQKALDINPTNHLAYLNLGWIFEKSSRYSEALECYREAIKIRPEEHKGWFNQGNVLLNLSRYQDAIKSYNKALRINPNHTTTWNNRGIALLDLEEYSEAIKSYNQAIQRNPTDPYPYYNKACCYALQGDTQNALSNLAKSFALDLSGDFREGAEEDPDFASIRSDQRFQALLKAKPNFE